MGGRRVDEAHRAATPLELLFDLAFVVAFGTAANELAHALSEEHVRAGLIGFAFAAFAVSWAWINFSWFASAYDTDDWIYRLTTMVQMAGVLVVAIGIPDVFASIDHGDYIDNKVMVLGYVVMRVPMVFQWLRAAGQDPDRRPTALAYVVAILLAQAGWVALAFAHTGLGLTLALSGVLFLVELGGPLVAERKQSGTPWHPHHIAERYGLLFIIALGEGLIGTVAGLRGVYVESGWTTDFVLFAVAGVALTFGIWWTYFVAPCGELLAAHRERSFGWGYGHIVIFGAVVAIGAGLHVAAYFLEHHSHLGPVGTVLSVVVPTGVYTAWLYGMYAVLTRTFHAFHVLLLALSVALCALAVVMAVTGVSVAWTLVVVALVPWVTVIGYETVGHRHDEDVLASLE